MPIYTASRISADANILYPDVIAIDSVNVTYYKGRPFGYETMIIPRCAINGVHLNSGILFTDIIISSSGKAIIKACGFKRSIAKQIVNSLI